ncbi:MAG: hypothetical protein HZC37_26580 [Burkholderiales bacterium]|nr:hypothetical protein [Burkholderiales bacterium]
MRRHAKLTEGHASVATDATDAWVESNERLCAGLLELNTQMWAGWIAFHEAYWQQARTLLDEMPLWMNWQFGTEQLA